MRKGLCLLAYLLILLIFVTGCSGKTVAIVNGQKISETELKTRLNQVAAMYGYDLESKEGKELSGYLEEQVLRSLTEEKVVLQAAAEKKLVVKKEEIEAEIKKIRAQFSTEQEFKGFLKERKFTEKDMETFIRNQLILDMLFDDITKDITTTTKDIKQYYEDNKTEFYEPEQVRAIHILVNTEEEAKAVIARVDKGEDFGKLAEELSIDPTAKQNKGDIGYFDRNAPLVDEFKDAAFLLKEGQYTKTPVKTDFGYHVIKLEDRKPGRQRSFEDVKSELEDRFIFEEKNAKFSEYVDSLMGKAVIEIKMPEKKPEQQPEQPKAQDSGASTEPGKAAADQKDEPKTK